MSNSVMDGLEIFQTLGTMTKYNVTVGHIYVQKGRGLFSISRPFKSLDQNLVNKLITLDS